MRKTVLMGSCPILENKTSEKYKIIASRTVQTKGYVLGIMLSIGNRPTPTPLWRDAAGTDSTAISPRRGGTTVF